MGRRHVIPGVEKGLMGACVGEKRRLIIPPALAYGPNGDGGVIPPDATIAFEIDIFEIYIKGMFASPTVFARTCVHDITEYVDMSNIRMFYPHYLLKERTVLPIPLF